MPGKVDFGVDAAARRKLEQAPALVHHPADRNHG